MAPELTSQAVPENWWDEGSGFFGNFYLVGDDSIEGHLKAKCSQAERTKSEVDGVCRLARLRPREKILDVPCGAGRHSLGLAELGYEIVGVDLNSAHLARARRDAEARGLPVTFVHGDMLTLDRPQSFDVVINMFYSFGFFSSDDDNRRVLRNFRTALKPGGRFVMHTDVNLARIRSGAYRFSEVRHLADGGLLRIQERFDSEQRRVVGSWEIEQAALRQRQEYSVRVYEVDEFSDLCRSCGFEECSSFGSWSGDPYTQDSEEIIFVAR